MTNKTENRGGKREGAGRKRVSLPRRLNDTALVKLQALVEDGNVEAIRVVLADKYPALRNSEELPPELLAILKGGSIK
jgi:hypothetical protein